MDFTNMDASSIATGVDSDGTAYLQKFLIEYTKLFPGTVNPSCSKCLQDYVNKYKKAMSKTELHPENSGYKLKAMYEGIPLEFGSQVMVTNANLTDEYAKILLGHEEGQRFFAHIPEAVELTGREKLQADYDTAEKALNGLAENVHHNTRKAAERKLEEAKEALEKYDAENKLSDNNDDANIKIVLTEADILNTPNLTEAGFKVGDSVTVDKLKYSENGTIEVTGTGKPE